MESISRYSIFNLDFASMIKKEGSIILKHIDFNPEVENEVIRDSFSQTLDRSLFNQIEFGDN